MTIRDDIKSLADRYAGELKLRIDQRVDEMERDDRSHVLIYRVLGITEDEGKLIDVYQNKGRFLYKYAGWNVYASPLASTVNEVDDLLGDLMLAYDHREDPIF